MDKTMETLAQDMPEEKRAVFERVWKRVMNSGSDNSPEETAGPWASASQVQAAETALVPATPADQPQGDYPSETGMGVLGENCLECAGLLQELIRRRLDDWRTYQALSKRVGGGPGRVFASLAGEEKRQAKELCAAYFLISGVRYWPDPEKAPVSGSYLANLRRRFRLEQESMAAYLAGGEIVSDPCLRQLFFQHAKEAWERACKVRHLVEQA